MKKNKFDSIEDLMDEFLNHKYKVVVLCGLPGSGKSRISRTLVSESGFFYMSSDYARIEVLKIHKVRFHGSNDDYAKMRPKYYKYIRGRGVELVGEGGKVVFDATNLNIERDKLMKKLKEEKTAKDEVLVVGVTCKTEIIAKRMRDKKGENADGRSWHDAWKYAYDWHVKEIEEGRSSLPNENNSLGYRVVMVENN